MDISHLKDVSYLDCINELFWMIKMKQEWLAWDWKMCKDDGNDKLNTNKDDISTLFMFMWYWFSGLLLEYNKM